MKTSLQELHKVEGETAATNGGLLHSPKVGVGILDDPVDLLIQVAVVGDGLAGQHAVHGLRQPRRQVQVLSKPAKVSVRHLLQRPTSIAAKRHLHIHLLEKCSLMRSTSWAVKSRERPTRSGSVSFFVIRAYQSW